MPEILMIHDVEFPLRGGVGRWAYAHRTYSLQKYAPAGWDVTRISVREILDNPYKLQGYELIFNIDYMVAEPIRVFMEMVDAGCPLVTSFNRDRKSNTEFWDRCYESSDFVICNGHDRYFWALDKHGTDSKVCCISNGVDIDHWGNGPPIAGRQYDVIWTGSSTPKKKKGYQDVIIQLVRTMDQEGISHSIRPISNWKDPGVLNVDEQREWYHSGRVILSCSRSEGGGPSALLEGMAAGCVPVTTLAGSVEEFADSPHNCVVCDPSPASFIKGIRYALKNIDEMSRQTRRTIDPWSYGNPGNRELWFFELFRRLIAGQVPEAFHYARKDWAEL